MSDRASDPRLEGEWLGRLEPARLFSLEHKVAIVTGGAGGIGRWLAAGMAKAGAAVIVTDRDPEPTGLTAAELTRAGYQVVPCVVDLEDDDAARRIVGFAMERFGRLDVLVNNAGINSRVPMLRGYNGVSQARLESRLHKVLRAVAGDSPGHDPPRRGLDHPHQLSEQHGRARRRLHAGADQGGPEPAGQGDDGRVRASRSSDKCAGARFHGDPYECQSLDARNQSRLDYGPNANVPTWSSS